MARDIQLKCVGCSAEFEFSMRDQLFYQDKGWDAPRRCKTCRAIRHPEAPVAHQHGDHGHAKKSPSELLPKVTDAASTHHVKFRVNCSTCGVETSVPFKPDPKRPAFCKTCLAKSKSGMR
ncbi:MAG: CxxC-x17-CxxC domain-containing protein [Planctomycetota bacterium]